MTVMRAIQQRKANAIQTPMLKSLYRDQFFYYIIIIFVRAFNLIIWNFLPPTLLFLGMFFIWALVMALVSRIMLNLRRVACESSYTSETFFAETAYSTGIVWARGNFTYDGSPTQTITSETCQEVPEAYGLTPGENDADVEEIQLQEIPRREVEIV
ncbi:hypothetical protein FRB90_009449 [Tulasnella sp. 427]|nr:hypothetical protein FRB90_009449 [Tulasnella sp. 427]